MPRRGSRVQISSPAPFRPPAPAGLATAVWSEPKKQGSPAKARYPSGKGEVCKTFMRRFDPGPRLQTFSSKVNTFIRLRAFSTAIHTCVFFALNRGQSAKIGLNWGGGRTKTGPGLHQREYKYKLRSCAAGPIYPQYPSGANMLAAGSVQTHGFPHKSENDVTDRDRRKDTLALGSFSTTPDIAHLAAHPGIETHSLKPAKD